MSRLRGKERRHSGFVRSTDAAGRLGEALCATTSAIRVVFSIDGDGEMARWEDGGRVLIEVC